MRGTTALQISKKMNQQLSLTKRQLITSSDSISTFNGYLSALVDVHMIAEDEETAFMREFIKLLIE